MGRRRNLWDCQRWRAAKFLMQRSEHPSGLFAGLAETDPPFLWAGDTVGIALTEVTASRSPVRRSWLSR